MAYFFQTHMKLKTIAARYTNHPLVSIPSQNRFLIRASQHPESRHFKKNANTDTQTHGLFSIEAFELKGSPSIELKASSSKSSRHP